MSADRCHFEFALSEVIERSRPFVDGAGAVEALPTVMTAVGEDVGERLGQRRLLRHHQHRLHPRVFSQLVFKDLLNLLAS